MSDNTLLSLRTDLHRESKKRETTLLSTVSPNIDRFSKFFHTQQETRNKEMIKDSTIPQTRRYTTLCNVKIDNYKQSETMPLVNDKF